jgi:GMC oxidoreductase
MPPVRLYTKMWRPDRTITVRAESDWGTDIPGHYNFGAWSFVLPGAAPVAFKFVLDYTSWQYGQNLVAGSPEQNDYGQAQVQFDPAELPDAEAGVISRTFFDPDLTPARPYDVIVVGSGVGGGVLADELSDRGARTLVLEAGSYLFPTHISNLPHAHQIGVFSKHVWGLWDNPQFRFTPYVNEGAGSVYGGGMAYCLGGRSVFWGGLTPRMRAYEFEQPAWPPAVRDALLKGPHSYYDKAEQLLKVDVPLPSEFQNRSKQWLERELGSSFTVSDAPMAVQRQASEKRTLSAGMFSTADLLFESRATPGAAGNQNLVVNLNNAVQRVELGADGRVARVVTYDRLSREQRVYTADRVVLAAGALETARIAQQSGLAAVDTSGTLGNGITDHQLWYVHFALPTNSPLFSGEASAKIVIQRTAAAVTDGGWNAVLELGSDWNQGRYVDEDILEAHVRQRGEGTMLGELVFLTTSELLPQNYVRHGDDDDGRPMKIHMERGKRANVMLGEMNAVKETILRKLGAYALPYVLQGRPRRRDLVVSIAITFINLFYFTFSPCSAIPGARTRDWACRRPYWAGLRTRWAACAWQRRRRVGSWTAT